MLIIIHICPTLFREQSMTLGTQFDLIISTAMAKECINLRKGRLERSGILGDFS